MSLAVYLLNFSSGGSSSSIVSWSITSSPAGSQSGESAKADAAHEVGTRSDLRRLRQAVLTFVVVVVAHAGEALEKAWESNRERECQSSETPTTAYARWTGCAAGVLIAGAQTLLLRDQPPRTYALRPGWADVPELAMWAARG
jgi:hypothetical protein